MNKRITPHQDSTQMCKSRGYSKIFKTLGSFILLLTVFAAGCKKDDFDGEISGLCPVVVSTDPMDKAVDVVLNKVISITFNTDMKASTINSSTFTIKQGANVIAGTIAPTSIGTTFTFTPTTALLPFTTYTGTVTTGATDTLRTAMIENYVLTFTTIPAVTITATPAAGGTFLGAGSFAQSSAVTVTATPGAGYTFTNWTEGPTTVVSTSPSYLFTMAGNRALVANFAAVGAGNLALNLASSPAAGGTTTGSGSFAAGSNRAITATANAGYTFVNWTDNGAVVSTSSNFQLTLNSSRSLVANFKVIPASQFAVILSSSPAAGGTTDGEGAYSNGTSVTISAVENIAYTFTNWTDKVTGAVVSTSASYTFPLSTNRTLVANFAIKTFTLNVSATLGGTVSKSPNQASHNYGTTAVVTATPSAGFIFSSWSGDATGSVNPLTVTMTSDKNITANFTAVPVSPVSILGSASLYGAFGGNAGITNQGINTRINNGKIGTTAASTLITGFRDGLTGDVYTVTGSNDGLVAGGIFTAPPAPGNAVKFADAQKGLLDAQAAYLAISPAMKPGGSDPGAGELGGLTLAPGTYKSAGATFKITGSDLVLDAKGDPNAVWIFQTPAGLTVGTASVAQSVKFLNGVGSANNVHWYVGSQAVINYGGGGVMTGNIIATAGVTLSSPGVAVQTVLNGRALSLVASVTMVNTTINVPQ